MNTIQWQSTKHHSVTELTVTVTHTLRQQYYSTTVTTITTESDEN